nr:immunoglobulin heavy chain junction region [Mus musculus]
HLRTLLSISVQEGT